MSWLRWKQEKGRRKSFFIVTNPVTILQCVIVSFIVVMVFLSQLTP